MSALTGHVMKVGVGKEVSKVINAYSKGADLSPFTLTNCGTTQDLWAEDSRKGQEIECLSCYSNHKSSTRHTSIFSILACNQIPTLA